MSLTTDSMSAADLAAITGNTRGNDSFGYNGFEWIIILFLFMMFGGGWGNNRGGNSNSTSTDGLYPWMNMSDRINNGFTDVTASVNAAQTAVTQQLYSNQIADMQQSFASQQAMNQGFNSLQAQLAQCCCDNRLATAQTQNIIQNEGNATRFADANNTRDIIDSQTRGTQAILDKLCQLELDNLKSDNANLRTQLSLANLQASQTAQTAELRQNSATQLNQLVSELRSCPIPAQPVYGSQPIFTCGGNSTGCGCGS